MPLTIVGIFSTAENTQFAWYALAFLCMLGASYGVWRTERLKVIELSAVLEPKVNLTFRPFDVAKAITPAVISTYGQNMECDLSAVYLEITARRSMPPFVASAHILTVLYRPKNENTFIDLEIPYPLTISENLVIKDGMPTVFQLLHCDSITQIIRPNAVFTPIRVTEQMSGAGTYAFVVAVNAGAVTEKLRIHVEWTGRYDTIHAYQAPTLFG